MSRVFVACGFFVFAVGVSVAQDDYFAPNGTELALPPLPRPVQKSNIDYQAEFESEIVGQTFAEFAGNYSITQALSYNGVPYEVWNLPYYQAVRANVPPGPQNPVTVKWKTVITGPARNPGTSQPRMASLPLDFELDDLAHAGTLTLPSGVEVNLTATSLSDTFTQLPEFEQAGDQQWNFIWGDRNAVFDEPIGGHYYLLEGQFTLSQIPEPATLTSLFVFGSFILHRRRQAATAVPARVR